MFPWKSKLNFNLFFLHSFESITIPHREDARHSHLSKRWDSVRPLGMFKSTDQEFLLCYDGINYLSFFKPPHSEI